MMPKMHPTTVMTSMSPRIVSISTPVQLNLFTEQYVRQSFQEQPSTALQRGWQNLESGKQTPQANDMAFSLGRAIVTAGE